MSPTVSETSRCPFPCQSEVFVHCPLSSWLSKDSVKKITWTSEPSLLLILYNSVCYFCPMNHRVVLYWLHEVLYSNKPKHRKIPGEKQKQNWKTVRWRTDLINPHCLEMQENRRGMLQSSSTEVPSKPQQGWLEYDIQLVSPGERSKEGVIVSEDFPQLFLLSYWFELIQDKALTIFLKGFQIV